MGRSLTGSAPLEEPANVVLDLAVVDVPHRRVRRRRGGRARGLDRCRGLGRGDLACGLFARGGAQGLAGELLVDHRGGPRARRGHERTRKLARGPRLARSGSLGSEVLHHRCDAGLGHDRGAHSRPRGHARESAEQEQRCHEARQTCDEQHGSGPGHDHDAAGNGGEETREREHGGGETEAAARTSPARFGLRHGGGALEARALDGDGTFGAGLLQGGRTLGARDMDSGGTFRARQFEGGGALLFHEIAVTRVLEPGDLEPGLGLGEFDLGLVRLDLTSDLLLLVRGTGGELEAHFARRLGGLREYAQRLIEADGVAFGGGEAVPTLPRRQKIDEPQRDRDEDDHPATENLSTHVNTVGHGTVTARHPRACRRRESSELAGGRDAGRVRRNLAPLVTVEHAVRHLFAHQGERVVVAPVAVDVDVPTPQPLVAEPELLDHPQARVVLGSDADLDAMKIQRGEADIGGHRDADRRDVASRVLLGHPVADRRGGERTAGDTPHVQLAGDLVVPLHDEGDAEAVAILLQEATDAETHVERHRAIGAGGLPGPQPRAVVDQLLLEDARIAVADETDRHLAVPPRDGQVHGGQRPAANSLNHGRSAGPRSSRSAASWTIALM